MLINNLDSSFQSNVLLGRINEKDNGQEDQKDFFNKLLSSIQSKSSNKDEKDSSGLSWAPFKISSTNTSNLTEKKYDSTNLVSGLLKTGQFAKEAEDKKLTAKMLDTNSPEYKELLASYFEMIPMMYAGINNDNKEPPKEVLNKLKESNGGVLPDLSELKNKIQSKNKSNFDSLNSSLNDLMNFANMNEVQENRKNKEKADKEQLSANLKLEDLNKISENEYNKGEPKYLDFQKLGINKDETVSKSPLVYSSGFENIDFSEFFNI